MCRTMKDSKVDFLNEIPENWKESKAKHFLSEKSIKNHPDAEVLSLYREYGIIPKDSRDDNHNVTSLNTSNYKFVEKNNVVINKMKAWQGSLAVSNYEGIVSPAYYVYEIKNLRKIFPKYLHFLLRNKMYAQSFMKHSKGLRIGQWDLDKEQFNNMIFPIPPYRGQIVIANFLDEKTSEIDNIVEKTKQSIEELKAYKQSLITETVTKGLNPDVPMKDSGVEWIGKIPIGWTVGRLKYFTKIKRGASPRPIVKYLTSDSKGYNWIKIGDTISGEKYINSTSQKITIDGAKKSVEILPGDLVMSNSMSIGRPYISNIRGYIHDGWLAFNFDDNRINSMWLYYVLTASINALKQLSLGTTVNNLNIERVQSLSIPFYNIEEQNQIASYLDNKTEQIDNLINKKQQMIEELESYKQSLIYEYVTGKKEVK